ncbi:hypothetical protein [Laspinema palackyanum]|uniref:hypothetical protein n=1 Tax=Laspinema palackyanum TaxID=3231601 RepID=UPI00345CC442|nr:hypothetical protein [Laspinema sp. D2c]
MTRKPHDSTITRRSPTPLTFPGIGLARLDPADEDLRLVSTISTHRGRIHLSGIEQTVPVSCPSA